MVKTKMTLSTTDAILGLLAASGPCSFDECVKEIKNQVCGFGDLHDEATFEAFFALHYLIEKELIEPYDTRDSFILSFKN